MEMAVINLSIGVPIASLLRFIILETLISLIAAPLYSKTIENIVKRCLEAGVKIQIGALDFGWLTPVNIAFASTKKGKNTSAPSSRNLHQSNSTLKAGKSIIRNVHVIAKLFLVNALLLAALISVEMTADAVNEIVRVHSPVRHHSDLKKTIAALSVDTGALLDRIEEVDKCTHGKDALHYQNIHGTCVAREVEPTAWATLRGRESEYMEQKGDQEIIKKHQWNNFTLTPQVVRIEGHEEGYFFWGNEEVTMYCHDLREGFENIEPGNINGHCAVMSNVDEESPLYLTKVPTLAEVESESISIVMSESIDILGIKLNGDKRAHKEIMFISVTIAKRYLVLGVSIFENRVIQDYYPAAATTAKVLRTITDGFGGDDEIEGEHFVERIQATQSVWSVVLLTAVVFSSIISFGISFKKGLPELNLSYPSLIKKLGDTAKSGENYEPEEWPQMMSDKDGNFIFVQPSNEISTQSSDTQSLC